MRRSSVSACWDAEYRRGRYAEDPPLPFTEEIVATLRDGSLAMCAGLYVGCGNGRNYLPLVKSGLRLFGLDLSARVPSPAGRPSAAGIRATDLRRLPGIHQPAPLRVCGCDFRCFQHGVAADVARYFSRVRSLLSPGGLFFLRVNAASTAPRWPHTVIERNGQGGFTVLYGAGPKQGIPVHFYARDELLDLAHDGFALVAGPREDVALRAPPEAGSWVQWEAIWQRTRR